MKNIQSVNEFYQLIVNAEKNSSHQVFYFHSPWQDSNSKDILENMEKNPVNGDIYTVDLFEFPELSARFKLNRSPALVTYWGDSHQYRTYDIPSLIRRSYTLSGKKSATK
jgi:hypothetical protein